MPITFIVLSTNGSEYQISCLGPENTVYEIKEKLEEQAGIAKDMIMLVYKGARLENDSTLEKCAIQAGCKVSMVLALKAG